MRAHFHDFYMSNLFTVQNGEFDGSPWRVFDGGSAWVGAHASPQCWFINACTPPCCAVGSVLFLNPFCYQRQKRSKGLLDV